MAELLNIGEMLQMAVQDEKTGLAFYSELRRVAKSDLVKKEAVRFAEQEKYHLQAFTDMLKSVKTETPRESYPGEYVEYVKALIQGKMFPPEGEAALLARNAKTDKEALQIAIQFERNTLLFFGEIRNFVPTKDQEVVEKIMDEERQHIVDLSALVRQV